jgi:hypothetical protein
MMPRPFVSVRPGRPEQCAGLGVSLKQQRTARGRFSDPGAAGTFGPVALALLLGRRGRRTWQCPHSTKGDILALNKGSGFDPQQT